MPNEIEMRVREYILYDIGEIIMLNSVQYKIISRNRMNLTYQLKRCTADEIDCGMYFK